MHYFLEKKQDQLGIKIKKKKEENSGRGGGRTKNGKEIEEKC